MKTIDVLIIENDPEIPGVLENILVTEGFSVHLIKTADKAIDFIESIHPQILIMGMWGDVSSRNEFIDDLMKGPSGSSLQIIFLAKSEEEISGTINTGGDDFITLPVNPVEFIARVRAAKTRCKKYVSLFQELDFFREAVKHEEEVSAQVLDQKLHLRKAFQRIDHVNQELEKSNKQLEEITKYDLLSGLLNRLTLFSMMEMEIERSVRTDSPLAGIMIDIDNFKVVNDTYGHFTGDQVIRLFGRALKSSLRKYDHAGRYGGEEFFIILPDTQINQANRIAERFRRKIADSPFEADGISIKVTASLGISPFRPGESRGSWIKRTDRALYQSKKTGRNRVSIL
jgi:diguanylate cyclase (GGDEF)-like protein